MMRRPLFCGSIPAGGKGRNFYNKNIFYFVLGEGRGFDKTSTQKMEEKERTKQKGLR